MTSKQPAMTGRDVIEGEHPSAHASVRKALELLHAGPDALQPLATELADGIVGGAADVHVDRHSRLLYATDASIYEMEPVAVVYPRGVNDVQHVLRVAGRRGVAVLPRGGGTSLAGQGVNHAIVLDFTPHMGQVLEINAAERWARVQPGVVLTTLNDAVREHGLQYAIDPSTANRATIGGGIGNNSCGAHSAIHGKTIDHVLSVDVVLADGSATTFKPLRAEALQAKLDRDDLEGRIYRDVREIARDNRDEVTQRFPRILRRVSGYNLDAFVEDDAMDLSRMIVGSEGTLAVLTEARVRLVPIPTMKALAAVHFRSVVEAAEATVAANAHAPSAVELIGSTIIERCRESSGYASLVEFVQGEPGALLMIEFYGESEQELQDKLSQLASDFERRGLGYATVTATTVDAQTRMWRMREAGLGLLMSVKGDAKPVGFVEDTAVAPERLAQFVARFDAAVRSHGLTAGYYGHASVGCLHIRPLVNVKDAAGLDTVETLAGEIADLVLEFGGSLSGEHGDGILRGAFTERMFGARLTEAFRQVKRAFDPAGILNPGKIVDTPPFRDNLRLSPSTVNRKPTTYLDFSADGSLAQAVELCNGQGACRKLDGTMCPSYMVTKDEEHSTRGRANLLRQALNGVLPAEELSGERIHAALDLCVECKACRAECPSGVDMAKLKYEVLTKYHEAHGLSMRDRAFAHINAAARAGNRAAPLLNALAALRPLRALLERTGGVHRERDLPKLARESFPRWHDRHTKRRAKSQRADTDAPRGDAVLFDDTFTDYFHPEVGRAATAVLEALGYRVRLVKQAGCCGRPAISRGMLGTARDWARRNVEALLPYAERGVPIVGVEPSCLLTFRDEYPDLLRSDASRTVAGQAVLLDELVASLAAEDDGVTRLFRADPPRRILLHGHCHQKAIVGMEPTLRALSLVPGYEVELIDSACCGMAGSFGFETEHYDISRKMGELTLFPAVEAASTDTVIAITGVSCRQQIDHFTSRTTRHVAELLADALITDAPTS